MAFETDTSQTSLAQIVEPLRRQNIGLTGYHVLPDPLEALAARIQLINKAERSLTSNTTFGTMTVLVHWPCMPSFRQQTVA